MVAKRKNKDTRVILKKTKAMGRIRMELQQVKNEEQKETTASKIAQIPIHDKEGRVLTQARLNHDDFQRLRGYHYTLDPQDQTAFRITKHDGRDFRQYLQRDVLGLQPNDGRTAKFLSSDRLNCTRTNLEEGKSRDMSYLIPPSSKGIRFSRYPARFIVDVEKRAKKEGLAKEILDLLHAAVWDGWSRSSKTITMTFDNPDDFETAKRLQETGGWRKFFKEWLSWDRGIAIKSGTPKPEAPAPVVKPSTDTPPDLQAAAEALAPSAPVVTPDLVPVNQPVAAAANAGDPLFKMQFFQRDDRNQLHIFSLTVGHEFSK